MLERNHIYGFILIFATLFVWSYFTKPTEAELKASKQRRDSIENLKRPVDTFSTTTGLGEVTASSIVAGEDTIGAPIQNVTLENDFIKLTLSSKGAKIVDVELKKHKRSDLKNDGENVRLWSNAGSKFEFLIPGSSVINTADVRFEVSSSDSKKAIFRAIMPSGQPLEITYAIINDYNIDFKVKHNETLTQPIALKWVDVLPKLEKSELYEQNLSTVYFKENEKSPDYCNCTRNSNESKQGKLLDWISHNNQFFNSSLIPQNFKFEGGQFSTLHADLKIKDYTKIVSSEVSFPKDKKELDMEFYIGPNEFKRLKAYDNGLEQVIPFGSSIFGTINRYIMRPAFDFLASFISSKGLVIILLIFIIKMLLYPLLYKMLYGQAKMAALKPELDKLKAKFPDDMQKVQVESMKVYQEYGVSPLSGCLPMLLQMPIWIALYRFFPASITFRRESFLWAPDLASYDAFFQLGFEIPFMGSHISLFTLLWAVSTVAYTYYSTKDVDMSANPAMKYVQYIMPLMFLGFFNSYASGLTSYMFFSNLINIIQIILTKNFLFDQTKIRKELDFQKANPKKKSGFQAKLEEAMKQQQALSDKKKK